MSLSDLPELLTPAEFFEFTRQGRSAGYAFLRSGKIQVVSFGRALRIRKADLEAYIQRAKTQG